MSRLDSITYYYNYTLIINYIFYYILIILLKQVIVWSPLTGIHFINKGCDRIRLVSGCVCDRNIPLVSLKY